MLWLNAAASVLSSLPLLAYAAPVADNKPRIDYDAIIVGGGPAGLAALSALARVRRNVLLVDSGEYRNAATRHQHDVLGYDGKLESLALFLPPKEEHWTCIRVSMYILAC